MHNSIKHLTEKVLVNNKIMKNVLYTWELNSNFPIIYFFIKISLFFSSFEKEWIGNIKNELKYIYIIFGELFLAPKNWKEKLGKKCKNVCFSPHFFENFFNWK